MSEIPCFLVEPTGNTRIRHVPCSCGMSDCDKVYDIEDKEWRRTDTGETSWSWWDHFGPGAMCFLQHRKGPFNGTDQPECYLDWDNDDGLHLHVMTPGGAWDIDGRASNCTRQQDRTHRCWIRHGEPPNITVDKNGDTCQAGAGSILFNNYHGFLRDGKLLSC